MKGKVYLVGAGPGDPRLLTLRGLQCLKRADIVLYDALANERLVDLAPAGAERILVGKRHGQVTVEQAEIERLLVEHARMGKIVVRLKGGDPFLFGRGGEEAEACRAAGVPFEIVPGVSSAMAVPAYAGIPLTHRRFSSVVTFVTGRPGKGREGLAYDWPMLARSGGTLVFLMAMLRIDNITSRLVEAGMDAETPAAAIRWGSTPRQQVVSATVADLARHTEQAGLRPPVIIVIGEVAALAERIGWYESLPLFGRRIVITRARAQAQQLTALLEEAGAELLEYPVIEIVKPKEGDRVARAYDEVGSYDWLILTSVNGVERFFDGLLAAGHDIRELAGVRIAAIGPATGAAIRRRGLKVAAEPSDYRAEGLLAELGELREQRVLLARAASARKILPEELRARGAGVDVVALYETVMPAAAPPVADLGEVDMVTFTSSSTVRNFDRLAGGRGGDFLARTRVAAIGPVTADTLRGLGIEPDVIPSSYTIPDLAKAIIDYFANRPGAK